MVQIKITSKNNSILGKTDGVNVFVNGKKVQTLKIQTWLKLVAHLPI